MHTKIKLLTPIPIDVIIYSKGRKFFWKYDYSDMQTHGAFKSYGLAHMMQDTIAHSREESNPPCDSYDSGTV